MGGCVVSVMARKNDGSLIEEPYFTARKDYGPVNEKITEDEADRSGVYRCTNLSEEDVKTSFEGWYNGENLLQELQRNCVTWKDRNAIAYRTIREITKEKTIGANGKEKAWEYVHLNDPTYITYGDFWGLLTAFGKGMAELGYPADSHVALYEDTRWEWITTMFGLWTQRMVGVTVYANLGQDALVYALKEADCSAVLCNGKNVPTLLQLMKESDMMEGKAIIYLDDLPAGVNSEGHKLYSWKEVVERGRASQKPIFVPSEKTTPVLVMYTSGTVAEPKGVVHTIGGITQGARALNQRLTELIGSQENETYLCYLPSAHIFEFICENIYLSRGTTLCFGTPRTLTDAFARPCGDFTLYNPFMIIAVPRVLEGIKKTVEARLPPPGTMKRKIFDAAYESRLAALKAGKDTPYWNEKVFAPIRQLMGTRMRGICCGGAPLADKTQEWVNVVLGQAVAQGYGQTEMVCNACVQRVGELDCIAGQFLWGVQGRLLDTEDYKHTDKPHPRGELLVRGHTMFNGYYHQEKLTEEVMLPDGWLRTGDVAEIETGTNQVRIIGRVKALAKNVYGEYIALENLEALYGQHPVAQPNGVCLLVDPHKPFICALVLTDESKTMGFAKTAGIAGTWPEILKQTDFNEAVTKSMCEIAKREKRMPFEMLRYVRVLNDEWTPDNGLVTASMKVRRTKIDQHYAELIAELFAPEQ